MVAFNELLKRSKSYAASNDTVQTELTETFKKIVNSLASNKEFRSFMRGQYSFVHAGLETELNEGFLQKLDSKLSSDSLVFTGNSVAYSVCEDNIFQTISVDLTSFALFHEGLINL